MSLAHALTHPYDRITRGRSCRPDSVKARLTPKRPRRRVENDEYAAFARRVLRAYSRRIAAGDIDALDDMADLAAEIDTAMGQAVTGLRAAGLLLGRDRHPARHHPPGRPATLGQPVTHPAATAALTPEPSGSGLGALADDTTDTVSWADFRTWERQLATIGHLLPPHPAARPHRGHRPDHRRDRPRLRHRAPSPGECCTWPAATAASPSARPARQVYKRDARQLVRAGLAGGKGIPETVTAHPCVFATLTAPSLRAGPLPAHARQDRPALPSPPRRQGPPLPARPRHLLPDPARRGRSPARPAAVRRLLRLRRRRAVQRLRGGPVAPVHHLPAPPARPPRRRQPQRPSARSCASATSRSPNTRHAASSTSTPSSASTPTATTTSHPRPATRAALLCDAIVQAADAVSLIAGPDSAPVRLGFGPRPTPGPSATPATCPAPGRPCPVRPWPTTSPSTPPNP